MQAETMHAGPMIGTAGAMEMEGEVPSNGAFERLKPMRIGLSAQSRGLPKQREPR
jgi:hypothetical protein